MIRQPKDGLTLGLVDEEGRGVPSAPGEPVVRGGADGGGGAAGSRTTKEMHPILEMEPQTQSSGDIPRPPSPSTLPDWTPHQPNSD